jgi:hypothetical protein
MVLVNGKRLTELMVEQCVGLRPSRTAEFKRLGADFFFDEDWLGLAPYQNFRSRRTNFRQVGFEPGQVPNALNPAI